jgi:hypothetical protein
VHESFQSKEISYKDWQEANFLFLATDNINSLKNRENPTQVIPEFFISCLTLGILSERSIFASQILSFTT